MSIVITELDGEIGTSIFSYSECENKEQVQEGIKNAGGQEKVVVYLRLPEDDNLTNLLSALCSFGDGLEGSFQHSIEKLLARIFESGKEYGREVSKKNMVSNMMKAFEHMAEETRLHDKKMIALDDLSGYCENDLEEIKKDIFKDPIGKMYRREECHSEICAQGSSGCSCQGTGYRYRPIQD